MLYPPCVETVERILVIVQDDYSALPGGRNPDVGVYRRCSKIRRCGILQSVWWQLATIVPPGRRYLATLASIHPNPFQ